eukprot:3733019-Ditylum_brightwellii.AAC.1
MVRGTAMANTSLDGQSLPSMCKISAQSCHMHHTQYMHHNWTSHVLYWLSSSSQNLHHTAQTAATSQWAGQEQNGHAPTSPCIK